MKNWLYILTYPTWIIVKVLQKIIPISSWKNKSLKTRNITLSDWTINSTSLNFLFGLIFCGLILNIIIICLVKLVL